MGDFWDAHVRVKELGKGSYGSAVLYKSKKSGRDYVVKEVDVSRMSSKDAQAAEQEAKVLILSSQTHCLQSKFLLRP
jgi:NIMA (never in mitosis gene a)-related kinase